VTDLSWARKLAGRFIVFDGPDGSGKSTQLRRFGAMCREAGVPLCEVRDPGGTPTGERIREILLDRSLTGMTVRCETLLYMASRAELVEQRILPALAAKQMVLADRFVSSTLAYQGAAGGVPASEIAAAAKMATRGLMPDLIAIFDLDERAAAKRLSPLLDRMEAKGAAFHKAVRKGYLDQAASDPGRYIVIDASGNEDRVWEALSAAVRERVEAMGSR
jgi:dTMP kinase